MLLNSMQSQILNLILCLIISLNSRVVAQASTASLTTSPPASSTQDCKSVASSHEAGQYGKNFDCGAGGGDEAKGTGRTLFIPQDNSPPPAVAKHRRMGRQDSLNAYYTYHQAPGIIDSTQLSSMSGAIVNTFYMEDAILDGNPQVVLSQGERDSIFSNAQLTPRGLNARALCNTSTSPIHLYTGLGNNVTIVQADIPYDGGIIHITDGFFTLPTTLSDTLSLTPPTSTLSSYLDRSNNSLDSVPSITVFAPNNDAFLATLQSNTTIPPDQINNLLNAHVIEGFVAYSPLLISGASYNTLSGARVNVSTTLDGTPVINGNATIVKPDIVIANGVVHVIDQLLFTPPTPPSPSAPPQFTGAAGLPMLKQGWVGSFGEGMWTVLLGASFAIVGAASFYA